MMNQEIFISRLKEARERKGLTIKALADACGVSLSAMNRYVALTAQPSPAMLCKIAQTLDVSLDWLLGTGKEAKRPTMGLVVRMLSMLLTTKVRSDTHAAAFEAVDGNTCIAIYEGYLDGVIDFDAWKKFLDLFLAGEIDEEMYLAWIDKKIKELDGLTLPLVEETNG